MLIKNRLDQFLRGSEAIAITVLTGGSDNPDFTAYAHFLFANHWEFILGDEDYSDGVSFQMLIDDDIYGEIILAIDNLSFLYQDDNALVLVSTHLLVQIDGVDPYPYVVIERR